MKIEAEMTEGVFYMLKDGVLLEFPIIQPPSKNTVTIPPFTEQERGVTE